jgi:hypothetical protein
MGKGRRECHSLVCHTHPREMEEEGGLEGGREGGKGGGSRNRMGTKVVLLEIVKYKRCKANFLAECFSGVADRRVKDDGRTETQ